MGHHHDDDDEEFEDEHSHPRGFLSGVALGGLVGVGVGLLLAPAAGRDTRRKLRDGAKAARDQAMEVAEGARDQALQAAEDVRAKAEDIQTTGREMLEENKRRIVRTAEAVKHSAQEAWTGPDTHNSDSAAAAGQSSSMYNLMGQSGVGQPTSGSARNGEAARTPSSGATGGSASR